jgi:hypothetical protein
MSIKDAIYRELRYGPVLTGLVDGAKIKQDMRSDVDALRQEGSYPIVIFRRVINTEQNKVHVAQERIEMELIGLQSSATKGDDRLEQIRETIINYFAGKRMTWGKYDANGTPNPNGGLRMSAHYVNTVDGFSEEMDEKVQILLFDFSFVRP